MKKVLCLLVLAVSGNVFSSNNTPPPITPMMDPNGSTMPLPTPGQTLASEPKMIDMNMANNHFASIDRGMPDTHPFIIEVRKMGKDLRWSKDLVEEVVMLVIKAHKQGIIDGLTTAGKYLQPGLTAMGTIVTKEQNALNKMMKK
jgi:hypothetical protein